jgi:hypothetical protein
MIGDIIIEPSPSMGEPPDGRPPGRAFRGCVGVTSPGRGVA